MDVNGGKLDFTATLDNSQIVAAIEETIKRVKGLSDGTASAGQVMQEAFDEVQQSIEHARQRIDKDLEANREKIVELQKQSIELASEINVAMQNEEQSVVEAKQREKKAIEDNLSALVDEKKALDAQKSTLEQNATAYEAVTKAMTENSNTQVSLKSRIKEIKNEMAQIVIEAQRNGVALNENTGRYAELRAELGRLGDIQDDISTQMRQLANDERQIAGVINGLSGLAGGMSAVTGAVSLFAGENENLSKVMTKLQSVMAITMGLQQLQQTLNKDSAFRLTTLASIKQWWGKVEAEANAKAAASTTLATAAVGANTVAEELNAGEKALNTAATGANTVAAGANTVALGAETAAATAGAGAFTLLATAIKSVPVIGWILAGISAVVAAVAALNSKEKKRREEERKRHEEKMAEIKKEKEAFASAASDNIVKFKELQNAWSAMGDNMNAKMKFIDANKEAIRSLGVEVNNLNEAEKLFVDKSEDYIKAQMSRAKAEIYREKAKDFLEKHFEYFEKDFDTWFKENRVRYGPANPGNGANALQGGDLPTEEGIEDMARYDYNAVKAELEAFFENARKEDALMEELLKPFRKPTTTTTNVNNKEDNAFENNLSKIKARYQQFYAWVNSSDKETQAAARTEFADLVSKGNTYLDYLKNQRTALIEAIGDNKVTKEQADMMRILNDQIAQETKDTVLSQFQAQLQTEMQGAQSLIDMLEIIKRKREELKDNSTGNSVLDEEQNKVLDDAELETQKKIAERMKQLMQSYRDFNDQRVEVDKSYLEDRAILDQQFAEAKTNEERERISKAIAARKAAYDAERNEINNKELQTLVATSDAYQKLFNSASNASKKMLRQILADAQTVLKAVKGEVVDLPAGISKELVEKLKESPEELEELYNHVLELQDKLNEESGYPFASLVQGFKQLASSAKLAAQAEKEVDANAKKATQSAADMTRDKAMKSLATGAAEAFNQVGQLGESIKELGKDIDDSGIENLGSVMSDLSAVASSALLGAAAGGWIGALIGGGLTILGQIFNGAAEIERQEHHLSQSIISFQNAVETLNLTLKETYNDGFGELFFEKIADAASKGRESLARVNEELTKLRWTTGDAYTDEMAQRILYWRGYDEEALKQIQQNIRDVFGVEKTLEEIRYELLKDMGQAVEGIGDILVKTKDYNWWQELWGADDEYKTISELAPGIINEDGSINTDIAKAFLDSYGDLLTDSQREMIQHLIELKEAYDDACEQIAEAIEDTFGYLGDEAKKALVDALVNGGDAWETWKQKGSKAIEELGEQLVYSLFLADKFAEFKNALTALYTNSDGMSPEEIVEQAMQLEQQFFENTEANMRAAQNWMEVFKQQAARYGFNIWSDENDSANSFYGAARTVTETTASLIHGQMNAMRVNQVSANDMLRQQLLMLSSIKSDTVYLRSIDNRLRNLENAASGDAYQSRIIHQ